MHINMHICESYVITNSQNINNELPVSIKCNTKDKDHQGVSPNLTRYFLTNQMKVLPDQIKILMLIDTH